jgi:hypothetical protein
MVFKAKLSAFIDHRSVALSILIAAISACRASALTARWRKISFNMLPAFRVFDAALYLASQPSIADVKGVMAGCGLSACCNFII